VRIAIDAMGGDNAPGEIVKGALLAAQDCDDQLILVGDKAQIEAVISDIPTNISIVHCSEVIDMDEKPAIALRKKADASICVATKLVRDGEADAVVSAGNTGAQMAAALRFLGRMPEVHRPAIAASLPAMGRPKLLLDSGANVDCKPEHLLQFAIMGSSFARTVMGVNEPLVGLLNIGSEETKGNSLTMEAYNLLKAADINFYGNIEARDIPTSEVNIIVCDGFVGNALLKFGEGLVKLFYELVKDCVNQSAVTKLGGLCLLPSIKSMQKKMDWEESGGAPLLGVNNVSIVCHGSSNAYAVASAVRVAKTCIKNNFIADMADSIRGEKVTL
jgi:glycerol-3-phosphate acyltransferase PlsX